MTMFSLTAIGDALGNGLPDLLERQQQQAELTLQRQEEERQLQERQQALAERNRQQTAAVSNQSFQSADANREVQLALLGRIDENVRKAEHAMELTDSGNPFDRVLLWAMQQTDPAYTRSGNSERINYLTSTSQALGYAEEIRQQGFQDRLAQINMQEAVALEREAQGLQTLQMMETQGQELINLSIQNQADRLTFLTQSNAMQTQAISNMTAQQVYDSERMITEGGLDNLNVGGVTLSAAQITARAEELREREYLVHNAKLQANASILKYMPLEELTRYESEALTGNGTAVINGQTVPLLQIQEQKMIRRQATHEENLQTEAERMFEESMLRRTQQHILEGMTIPELNRLAAAGGDNGDGTPRFDVGMVTARRDEMVAAQSANLDFQRMQAEAANPAANVVRHLDYLDAMQANAAPGSALYEAIETQRRATYVAAGWALDDSRDSALGRIAAEAAVAGSRQSVEQAIDAEAMRLAGGNESLATIHGFQLRGMPVPPQIVENHLLSEVQKGNSVEAWLPQETRALFTSEYQRHRAEILGNPLVRVSATDASREAAAMALQAVKQQSMQGITENFMTYQTSLPGNPIHSLIQQGKMQQGDILLMMRRADQEGAAQYQQANGLSDEEMEARLTGAVQDTELARTQTARLLMQLDALQPGTGKAYVDWWTDSAQRTQAGTQFLQAWDQENAKNTQTLGAWSLIRGDIQSQLGAASVMYQDSLNLTQEQEIARQFQRYITFDGNAGNMQAYLLQIDPSLTDADRTQIYNSIINPILQRADMNGLAPNEMSQFVEQSLNSFTPQTPQERSAYNKIMANRTAMIATLESMEDMVFGFSRPTNLDFINRVDGDPFWQPNARGYDWYRNILGSQ